MIHSVLNVDLDAALGDLIGAESMILHHAQYLSLAVEVTCQLQTKVQLVIAIWYILSSYMRPAIGPPEQKGKTHVR